MTIQLPSKKHQKVLNKLKTKKYIQEKSNSSNNNSKINWDAFHYQNLISQSLSVSQTLIQLFSFPNEQKK
jgi:hypothetical protein